MTVDGPRGLVCRDQATERPAGGGKQNGRGDDGAPSTPIRKIAFAVLAFAVLIGTIVLYTSRRWDARAPTVPTSRSAPAATAPVEVPRGSAVVPVAGP